MQFLATPFPCYLLLCIFELLQQARSSALMLCVGSCLQAGVTGSSLLFAPEVFKPIWQNAVHLHRFDGYQEHLRMLYLKCFRTEWDSHEGKRVVLNVILIPHGLVRCHCVSLLSFPGEEWRNLRIIEPELLTCLWKVISGLQWRIWCQCSRLLFILDPLDKWMVCLVSTAEHLAPFLTQNLFCFMKVYVEKESSECQQICTDVLNQFPNV